MKTIYTLCCMILAFVPPVSNAVPSERTAKTNVTGIVVDYDRRHQVVILKEFKGWDRKQTEYALTLPNLPIRDWVRSFDKSHAGIGIYKADMKKIRKGMRLNIIGYSYSTDAMGIYPTYDSLTVTK